MFVDLALSIEDLRLSTMSHTAAIELLKRAVQLDVERRLPDALNCYSEGIRMMLSAVKGRLRDG